MPPRTSSYEAFEVGWKKLGGWQIPSGTEVKVRVEGYLRPAVRSIPTEAAAPAPG